MNDFLILIEVNKHSLGIQNGDIILAILLFANDIAHVVLIAESEEKSPVVNEHRNVNVTSNVGGDGRALGSVMPTFSKC